VGISIKRCSKWENDDSFPFLNSVNANWFPKNQNLTISKMILSLSFKMLYIDNFYNSYGQPENYFRKKGIIVRNKRLTKWWWAIYNRNQLQKKWVSIYTSFRSPWVIAMFLQGQNAESGLEVVSPRQTSIYVKSYLCSRYMKSVCYHALRTMSENAYVKCGLWNRIASPHCLALDMIFHTFLF